MRKQNQFDSSSSNTQLLINNDNIFTLINTNNRISCKTHQNQQAKSICMDCNTFCCMIENCGQPHIYHSIENLDYLLSNQVIPAMNSLRTINKEMSGNKSKHQSNIITFKNNLKSFSVEEKKKVDEEYRKILQAVQSIYNNHMNDVNDFIDDLNQKFDNLQDKINTIYTADKEINNINSYINGLITKSLNINGNSLDNEAFISFIAKDAKNLNQKLKSTYVNFSKFDFEKEIKDIKSRAEKDYPKSDKLEYLKSLGEKLANDLTQFSKTKNAKETRKSLSKINKMVSMRNTMTAMNRDNFNNIDIDLDIFVRNLFEEINKIRKNPRDGVKYIDEYVDMINNNEDMVMGMNANHNQTSILNESVSQTQSQNSAIGQKISFIYDYLDELSRAKVSQASYEWDNDLSNSAEDYLKLTQGKIEKDFNIMQKQIQEIVVNNYYSNYDNIWPWTFIGSPVMSKIIWHFFSNEIYWDMNTRQNIIFSDKYNVVGICGISGSVVNKITLIANFSFLKK